MITIEDCIEKAEQGDAAAQFELNLKTMEEKDMKT